MNSAAQYFAERRRQNLKINKHQSLASVPDKEPQIIHRVTMSTFWRAFHQDGKISPAWLGCGARPTPFSITCKVVVYALAESAETLPLLLLYPLYVLCANNYQYSQPCAGSPQCTFNCISLSERC
jgi:hypothetical protein